MKKFNITQVYKKIFKKSFYHSSEPGSSKHFSDSSKRYWTFSRRWYYETNLL